MQFKQLLTDDEASIVEQSRHLQDRADLAFVVGNPASVMGETETRAVLVDGDETESTRGTKEQLGDIIAARLAEVLG